MTSTINESPEAVAQSQLKQQSPSVTVPAVAVNVRNNHAGKGAAEQWLDLKVGMEHSHDHHEFGHDGAKWLKPQADIVLEGEASTSRSHAGLVRSQSIPGSHPSTNDDGVMAVSAATAVKKTKKKKQTKFQSVVARIDEDEIAGAELNYGAQQLEGQWQLQQSQALAAQQQPPEEPQKPVTKLMRKLLNEGKPTQMTNMMVNKPCTIFVIGYFILALPLISSYYSGFFQFSPFGLRSMLIWDDHVTMVQDMRAKAIQDIVAGDRSQQEKPLQIQETQRWDSTIVYHGETETENLL